MDYSNVEIKRPSKRDSFSAEYQYYLGRIPSSLVGPVLEEEMKRQELFDLDLAILSKVHPDSVRQIRVGRTEYVNANAVDRLFCALGDPVDLWSSSKELQEAYETVNWDGCRTVVNWTPIYHDPRECKECKTYFTPRPTWGKKHVAEYCSDSCRSAVIGRKAHAMGRVKRGKEIKVNRPGYHRGENMSKYDGAW